MWRQKQRKFTNNDNHTPQSKLHQRIKFMCRMMKTANTSINPYFVNSECHSLVDFNPNLQKRDSMIFFAMSIYVRHVVHRDCQQ